jgi:NAD-dependent DNA ligase
MIKALPGNVDPEVINKVMIPKIIQIKYPDLTDAEVEEVLWNVSKWGLIKPRIKLNPIKLSGVTITYTSGFNAKYITDVLSAIHDDEVDLEINDQLSPGIMKPHNDSTYTCVVMPMRI